jgi:hypothetical protein
MPADGIPMRGRESVSKCLAALMPALCPYPENFLFGYGKVELRSQQQCWQNGRQETIRRLESGGAGAFGLGYHSSRSVGVGC